MTSIAEPLAPARGGSWVRTLLLIGTLGFFAWQTPVPWAGLWLLVPAAVAVSFLAAWRWGGWGVLAPVAAFAAAMAIEGPFSLWVWWIPVAALTGTWMGLREEGGGLPAGHRAWTLLPVLLLAALLPWMANYGRLVAGLEAWLRLTDQEAMRALPQIGYQGELLEAMKRQLVESAVLRAKVLPHMLPTLLFLWMVTLVSAGRGLAARFARRRRRDLAPAAGAGAAGVGVDAVDDQRLDAAAGRGARLLCAGGRGRSIADARPRRPAVDHRSDVCVHRRHGGRLGVGAGVGLHRRGRCVAGFPRSGSRPRRGLILGESRWK
ncbi:MAG: hypothetical protein E6K81_12805 [Candidatus Eisenbacteria bacterium]|uniref:Uncharacterized protein n=1 Tax=Eiseniibacteriota bacterium TaxID=2212470 RepID=A0A538U3A4_UNCEI|nr:MAG: hypothetical protein E6K81_12805 [Candidatus Eisenbacteria bacterium]